ncbi:MAG: hypothetical protein ABIJ09_06020 [Pseudomonadota bacterium]
MVRMLAAMLWLFLAAMPAGCSLLRLVDDDGPCRWRCQVELGGETRGQRSGAQGELCRCQRGDEAAVEVPVRLPVDAEPTGEQVCGKDGQTYPLWLARFVGMPVLHAGRCGQCSTPRDLAVYRSTRLTLTGQATTCAMRYFFQGREAAEHCTTAIGFTPGCAQCWVDNMACTIAHCREVCLVSRLTRQAANLPDGRLNPCLACDESYCGAPFIRCAGANRRRAGIVSDIVRPDEQVFGKSVRHQQGRP